MAKCCLKQILETEGIKQSDLARVSDISSGTINRTCNGKLMPAPTTRSRIIKALVELSGKEYKPETVFPNRKGGSK
jgi:predicted transcriptional regulator